MYKRFCISGIVFILSSYLAICQTVEYEKVYNYDTIYTKADTVFVNIIDTEVVYDTVNAFWNTTLAVGAELKNTPSTNESLKSIAPFFQVDLAYLGTWWYLKAGFQYSKYKQSFRYDFWEEVWPTPTNPDYVHHAGSNENQYQTFNFPFTCGVIFDFNSFSLLTGTGLKIQYTSAEPSNLILNNKELILEKEYFRSLNSALHTEVRLIYYILDNYALGMDLSYSYLINNHYKNLELENGKKSSLTAALNFSYFF